MPGYIFIVDLRARKLITLTAIQKYVWKLADQGSYTQRLRQEIFP